MDFRKIACGATFAIALNCPSMLSAEVNFPKTRNAVGPGEYYLLDDFGDWQSFCLRDENGEDPCQASTLIADLDKGLELDFAVESYLVPQTSRNPDVDVVPRAIVSILALSEAPHYEKYSAAISSIDGQPFDGYWCSLVELTDCNKGPDLEAAELSALLDGRIATITIYNRDATPEDYEIETTIEVDLANLRMAFSAAETFESEVFGIDLDAPLDWTEMCTIRENGVERRISYTYDEIFEAEAISYKEAFLGTSWGSCPSYVALAYLAPNMTNSQRNMFCLVVDEDDGIVGLQTGEQDAYRVCKEPSRSFCERVNDSKEAALGITGFAAGAVGSAVGTTAATGTTVVAHSSGAAILTGTSGYIAGTLGTIGTAALGVLTAPATITAATVSVIAVGGTVYVCSE